MFKSFDFELRTVSKCKFWLTFIAVIYDYSDLIIYCIIVLAKQGCYGKDLAIGIAYISQDEWNIRQTGCQRVVPKNARPFRMNNVGLFYA